MQATPGHFKVQANASQIHLEQNARLLISPIIQYHALQPLSQVPLNPQTLINSLRSLYLSQKTLSIFRIKAEQEWEFKVPLEDIYVRLGIIESKERRVRDLALDKHSQQIQDDRIPTFETIYEPKQNIEIEKLFEHKSLEKENAKRIYIQGAAGIGKSTLCHYIAYRWAKEELWQGIFSYLFWIPLRNLTLKKYPADTEYTPADLIAREYAGKIDSRAIEACINNAILREKTLLVLDGYDELSAEAQGNTSLATAFKELKELFPHILITSRPGSCSFNRSCELELLGFDKEGVERYIDRFFRQVQAEEKKQKLYHLLQSSPQVLSLAQIPINLTLLCCLFNEDPEVFDSTQSITMTAIYERIVNWMYKWFLLRRIDQGQSSQTKEKILTEKNLRYNQEVAKIAKAFEEMADFAMENNTLYLGKQEIDDFRGNAITSNELADCGLLRIPEGKGYFIHLTFQEFLTASKVANQYLQGENRQACQSFLCNYKFEPRYILVLRMIAGYLSLSTSRNRRYLNSSPLQSFFDDLFAGPHDLAVRSELHLIASCFEECQNPTQVRQYEGFIELVKDYMIDLSLLGLDFEGLLRNKSLFNHPKIMHTIERLLSDPHTIKNMLLMLMNLANLIAKEQRLCLEIVRSIVKILKDRDNCYGAKDTAARALNIVVGQIGKLPKEAADALAQILMEGDSDVTCIAAYYIETLAEQGSKLPKEALNALIQILKEGDSDATYVAAYALALATGQGGEFTKEMLNALIQILKEGDSDAISAAADALAMVAEQGGEFAKEALNALIQILKEGDSDAISAAADALAMVVEQGGEFAKEMLNALIQILKEGDSDAISAAATALGMVAEQGGKLPKEAVDALIQILKKGDSDAISAAATALGMVAEQGGKLPKEAVDALVPIPQEGDRAAKMFNVDVLGVVAKHGGKLPKEGLDALIQALKEGDYGIKRRAADALRAVAKQGEKLPKEALNALIQILKEGDSDATYAAADALGMVAEQGGKLPKEAVDAFIQILKEGDYTAKRHAANALGEVAQQGDEIANKALNALVQIFKEGGPIDKWYAVGGLKKVDKKALLKMSIEAFPLIASVCFFAANSFSVKGQQLQISDKTTTYFCKDKLMLNYEEIREKSPKKLAIWRKQLDNL
ncbi:hypothetical protein DB41_GC00300 [Neochlamydia sp. TUME1]|uniref:HEAT repeat domain-containing protein n=1 Tax=Neochlamydia sp. TUME1 TaxID=1478174 RepID=UPI000580AF0C|nr:HEAT repeat domain-containing protein [Neochlamydia sp. TUME1]KIC76463.1 hypothetical protein DB41_GC00300 [Neochlamydia sp. TUME1]